MIEIVPTERQHLMRDAGSKALINTNKELYNKRQLQKQNEMRIKRLEESLEKVTDELVEIRHLLASIVQRN